MFKKLIAKLRGKLAASPAKKSESFPSKPASPKQPQAHQDRAQQPRQRRGSTQSESSGRASSREGRGRNRGGRDQQRRGAQQPARIMDHAYEHPRREPVKPMVPVDVPKMNTAFSKLGLCDALAFGVQEKGYTEPTPIQVQSIPHILAGRDVIGSAQTGTGKTAAFALPIIQRLAGHGPLRCLILEPTRELALQVEEAFQTYAKFTDLQITIVYGGVGYGKQLDDLKRGVDILAATPGRLLDHMEQGNCSLRDVDILVLDEVDRMLDMGFLPDVKRIVQQTPKARQTLFFTATLPPEIASLASWALRDPVKV